MERELNSGVFEEMLRCFKKHMPSYRHGSVHFRRDDRTEMVFFQGDSERYGRIIIYQDAQDFNDSYNVVKDIMDEATLSYRIVRHEFDTAKELSHVSFTLNPGYEKACQQTQKVQEGKGSSWKSLLRKGG